MSKRKSERFQKMIEARHQQQARNLLRDAPQLFAQLRALDDERGAQHTEVLHTTIDDAQHITRRKDMPLLERAALVQIGLNNVCSMLNQTRPAGAQLIDVIGVPDPTDTHYGQARIAAHYDLVRLSLAEYERREGASEEQLRARAAHTARLAHFKAGGAA
jgi:hypothetical protein